MHGPMDTSGHLETIGCIGLKSKNTCRSGPVEPRPRAGGRWLCARAPLSETCAMLQVAGRVADTAQ